MRRIHDFLRSPVTLVFGIAMALAPIVAKAVGLARLALVDGISLLLLTNGADHLLLEQSVAATYGQVQLGQQIGVASPPLVIFDGQVNVTWGVLNTQTHTFTYTGPVTTASINGVGVPTSGTAFATSATSPITLSSSGVIACPTCVISGGGVAGTFDRVTTNANGSVTSGSTHASSISTPSDPTGNTSAAGLMMGLAGAITPTSSGSVNIIISGAYKSNNAATNIETVALRYGTGSAPLNAAALTGTVAGAALSVPSCATANSCGAWSRQAILTGLTVNTAYWIDVSWANPGGTAAGPTNIVITAQEF